MFDSLNLVQLYKSWSGFGTSSLLRLRCNCLYKTEIKIQNSKRKLSLALRWRTTRVMKKSDYELWSTFLHVAVWSERFIPSAQQSLAFDVKLRPHRCNQHYNSYAILLLYFSIGYNRISPEPQCEWSNHKCWHTPMTCRLNDYDYAIYGQWC